jgi:hypothetical protein
MDIVSNVIVGRADVKPQAPSHSRGVREGNQRGSLARERGLRPVGPIALATPRRSTGVNASARKPIDPRMPVLTPA